MEGFFMFQTNLKIFKVSPPQYTFFKKLIILMDGGYPSMEIPWFLDFLKIFPLDKYECDLRVR